MHQHRNLLLEFLLERIEDCRKSRKVTQETMAEWLRISARSYGYIKAGTYGCSATTLMFFFLILTEEEVIQLRLDFLTLVEGEIEYVLV